MSDFDLRTKSFFVCLGGFVTILFFNQLSLYYNLPIVPYAVFEGVGVAMLPIAALLLFSARILQGTLVFLLGTLLFSHPYAGVEHLADIVLSLDIDIDKIEKTYARF